MGAFRMNVIMSLLLLFSVGCSTAYPQARLPTYLGSPSSPTVVPADLGKQGTLSAGLVVINDVSFPDSAPQLSKESLDLIKKHIQARLIKEVKIPLESLKLLNEFPAPTGLTSLLHIGRDHHVAYLVLAVVSSTEIEWPDRFPMGGTFNLGGMAGFLNGYRAENFALAELALLDVKTGKTLLQTQGQSWASLERLAVPLESNVYPVVRRNYEMPPIYPTREDAAHDVLRAVASSDAIDQAVMYFKEPWKPSEG